MPRLIETAVEEGYLERERAEQYLAWNRNLEAGDAAHVTFDPLRQELGGLDYENPAPDSLPAGWQQATTGFAAGPPRYLKCRLASGATRPEWVIYLNAR